MRLIPLFFQGLWIWKDQNLWRYGVLMRNYDKYILFFHFVTKCSLKSRFCSFFSHFLWPSLSWLNNFGANPNVTYLKFRQIPRRPFNMFFPYKKQQIITINGRIVLEQKMPDKQVSPVSGTLQHDESRIWTTQNAIWIDFSRFFLKLTILEHLSHFFSSLKVDFFQELFQGCGTFQGRRVSKSHFTDDFTTISTCLGKRSIRVSFTRHAGV